jgi:hypothetical protein
MFCDAILKQAGGIYDTIFSDTRKTSAESLYDWLKTATYELYQNALNAGVNIPLPVDDVPLDFGAHYDGQTIYGLATAGERRTPTQLYGRGSANRD